MPGSDDLWLARTIQQHGPAPLWPLNALVEHRRRAREKGWADEPDDIEGTLGHTAGRRPIRAWFFPGLSDERALVIGGVHGNEHSGVRAVEILRDALQTVPRPYRSVLLVPKLFPDNVAANRGKGIREGSIETNRNFPAPGESLDTARAAGGAKGPLDMLKRPILPENIILMQLIERFRPGRIASVHATRHSSQAGIFADPHTVSPAISRWASDIPLPFAGSTFDDMLQSSAGAGTAADAALALKMAQIAEAGGARVAGNQLGSATPNTVWGGAAPRGASLGRWGPSFILEGGSGDRPPISVITTS